MKFILQAKKKRNAKTKNTEFWFLWNFKDYQNSGKAMLAYKIDQLFQTLKNFNFDKKNEPHQLSICWNVISTSWYVSQKGNKTIFDVHRTEITSLRSAVRRFLRGLKSSDVSDQKKTNDTGPLRLFFQKTVTIREHFRL